MADLPQSPNQPRTHARVPSVPLIHFATQRPLGHARAQSVAERPYTPRRFSGGTQQVPLALPNALPRTDSGTIKPVALKSEPAWTAALSLVAFCGVACLGVMAYSVVLLRQILARLEARERS